MTILQMSIQGGLLIILTVIVRSIWLNSLPKTAFIVMWEAAILRLLIPIKLPFDLSMPEKLTETVSAVQFTDSGIITSHSPEPNVLSPVTAPIPEKIALTVNIPMLIWLIGAAVFTLYFVITYMKCRSEFRTSLPIKSEFISSWLDGHKLRRTVTVRQCDAVSSPLTYGIINPVILLPKNIDTNNKEQLKIILLHELTHIRKFDGVLKLFSTAAVCVHWFNPLVWIMRELVSRDIELRCDESVLRELGIDSRADYALALIELEEKRSGLQPIGSGFSKSAVEERIVAIMKYKSKTVLSVIMAIVLAVAVTITTVAICAANKESNADDTQHDHLSQTNDSAQIPPNAETEDKIIVDPKESEAGVTHYVSLSQVNDGTQIPSYAETENLITVGPNETVIFTNEGSDFPCVFDIAVLKLNRIFIDDIDYSGDDNIEFGYIINGETHSSQVFDGNDPTKPPYDNFGKATDFGYCYRLPEVGNYMFYITNHDDKNLVLSSITLTQLHDSSPYSPSTENENKTDSDEPSPKSYQEIWGEDPPPSRLTIDRLYASGGLHPIRDIYKDGGIYTDNDITYPTFLESDGTYHEAYYATHFKKGEKAAVIIDLGEIAIEDSEKLSEYIDSLKIYSVVEFRNVKESYILTLRKIIWSPLGAPNGKTYLVSMFEAPNDGDYAFNSVNLGENDVPFSGHWVQLQNSDDPNDIITCRLGDGESARTELHSSVATSIELYSSIDSYRID